MAIEGVDGCGKTTQAKMLVDRLKKNRYKVIDVRPVYVLLDSTRLRKIDKNLISPRRACVSENTNKKSSLIRRALIGLAGYPYALATYMFMKFHSRNKIIVCDRYFYQFLFDLYGKFSDKVVRIFPKPDITFFLDGDLDLFYSRMDNSFDASVDSDYYTEVINLYRKIYKRCGFVQIDANLTKEAINDIMLTHLRRKMKR